MPVVDIEPVAHTSLLILKNNIGINTKVSKLPQFYQQAVKIINLKLYEVYF